MKKNQIQLRCNECGKIVSSVVSDKTIVRAWLTCPECLEKNILKLNKEDI